MTTAILSPREMLDRRYPIEAVMYAILTGTLGDSTLQPQVANRYLQTVVERSVIISEARRVPMTSNTRNIDRLVHSGRVMRFPNEGSDVEAAGAISFQQRQLIAGDMMAAEDWSRQTIEDNIEGDNLENTIVEVMGQLHARDMEELFLYGNADDVASPAFPDADEAGDAFRQNLGGTHHDGLLLLTDNMIDKQGAQADSARDIFAELMDAIPAKLLNSRPLGEWRFYVNSALERRYRAELGERSTPLGDRALFEAVPVFYQGIPVVSAPMLRLETRDMVDGSDSDIEDVTDAMLVHPNNIVVGFQRDVMADVEYRPRKLMFELTISARGDCNVEAPDAFSTILNVKLPDAL